MNRCRNCRHWAALNPDDDTAPEGHCDLPVDPGFWPFGYWPATLQSDGCGDGFALSKEYR